MRVLVTIDGQQSVYEVLGFEPQDDGSVILCMAEHCMDLIVHGINPCRMQAICEELLQRGYANMAEYETHFFDDGISEEDANDEDDMYEAVCPCCNTWFEFKMTPTAKALGSVRCPQCSEELYFEDEDEEEIGDDELIYETACACCMATIDVLQRDVDAGSVECPHCHRMLTIDAMDAENQTVGGSEEEDDE